jgi:hypothetical protein
VNGLQVLLTAAALSAFVLGVAFLAVYGFNKSVRKCGR